MQAAEDKLAPEEPLEIRLNGSFVAVTMRTPGADEELAIGFLVTEGIVRSAEDIWDIKRCGDSPGAEHLNIIEVVVAPERVPLGFSAGRQRYASASCGICGRASIESVRSIALPIASTPAVEPAVILSLPRKLRAAQPVFGHTGGLHAAGLFTHSGELLYAAEDIGRHNAVDKVIGKLTHSNQRNLSDLILMVSGRAGFEIVQKALVARIPVLCSVSAPSSLAVQLAVDSGMVLVGFVRGDSMNIYSGAEKLSS